MISCPIQKRDENRRKEKEEKLSKNKIRKKRLTRPTKRRPTNAAESSPSAEAKLKRLEAILSLMRAEKEYVDDLNTLCTVLCLPLPPNLFPVTQILIQLRCS